MCKISKNVQSEQVEIDFFSLSNDEIITSEDLACIFRLFCPNEEGSAKRKGEQRDARAEGVIGVMSV
ncbi:MAG: hypothetical protein MJZ41_03920 [Bacteroidaceae bacterium]|nr:hypothetical protein [Bacteroidaceae bacterium]